MENKYCLKHVYVNADRNEGLLPIKERTYTTKTALGAYEATIINAGTKASSVIILLDGLEIEVRVEHLKRGAIYNPNHPTIYGVGFLGRGSYKAKEKNRITKVYNTWYGILERCYSPTQSNDNPTYKDVEIHPDWHNFQNFAKWFYEESNYQDGWQLDKDLLSDGSKIYSPETCIFIPGALNSFLANTKSDNTSGYIGVSRKKDTKKWHAQINHPKLHRNIGLGYYTDIKDASNAYIKQRKVYTRWWKYVGLIKYGLPLDCLAGIK